MSNEQDAATPAIPHDPPSTLSANDLALLLGSAPSKSALRRKLLITVLIAAIGLGASIMSCVGQSFTYRQAHALEGIEQQLKEIRASCIVLPPSKSEAQR